MENNWYQQPEDDDQYPGYQSAQMAGQPSNQYQLPFPGGPNPPQQMGANHSLPSGSVQPGQYQLAQYAYPTPSQPHSPPYPTPTTQVYPMPPGTSIPANGGVPYATAGNNGQWALYSNPSSGAGMMYPTGNRLPMQGPDRAMTPQPVMPATWAAAGIPRSFTPGPGNMEGVHPHQSQSHYHRSSQHGGHSRGSSASSSIVGSPNPQMHKCPHCPYECLRKADVTRHIRSIHTQEEPYRCGGCGQGFVRVDARGRHWREQPSCAVEHTRRAQQGLAMH